jgi:hypothetical protein
MSRTAAPEPGGKGESQGDTTCLGGGGENMPKAASEPLSERSVKNLAAIVIRQGPLRWSHRAKSFVGDTGKIQRVRKALSS